MENKDIKILLVSLLFTFLLIIGFSMLVSSKQANLSEVAGLQVNPTSYELGEVSIDDGIVTKKYLVKNNTDEKLNLRKIATSCMCTEAGIVAGGKEFGFFGMEHATDKNPPINLNINPNEEIEVVVNFDPNAHGPEGVGPFEREVWLTFSDPAGVKTLNFSGRVVSK